MASRVTELLLRWGEGDERARDLLIPHVYQELRRVAQRQLGGEGPGHGLQATALVHETYLKLVDLDRVRWQNRAQFLAIAAQIVRRILVDHARARAAQKRGGGALTVVLDEELRDKTRDLDVCRLDDALGALEALDPAQARVVELRFFAGLTVEETALVMGSSPATVKREWSFARAWLRRALDAAAA